MGARLRVFLKAEEDRTLSELRTAKDVPQRVKDRGSMLRLNNRGWYIEKIAEYFNCHQQTVRETIHRWQKRGLSGLWETKGRGKKKSWQEEDLEYLELCLQQEKRTYNSKQLSEKLARERQVKLSPDHLRRVLKKRG
jgi:transposase